jgi:hypothetical protein
MEYDLKSKNLHVEETIIPANSLERNKIGNCTTCDAAIMSLSYHNFEETIIVVTKCTSCGSFYANMYDSEWNWINEVPVSLLPIRIQIANPIIDDLEGLERISIKKLEAVFSRGEIEALFASAKNETLIRQYLYRARRKYALFEILFDIRMEL